MATNTTRPASPLADFRERRGLNQERLAALSGVSRGWVGYLERNPEAMTSVAAEKLASVLEVRPEDLFLPAGEADR
jgi:transcriptional regulator with XRE-family HTH domain